MCVFCDLVKSSSSESIVASSDSYICVRDINPVSPTHLLFIPKKHIESLNEASDVNLLGEIMCDIKDVSKKMGISSYRVVINTGDDAGQTVKHLHIHLLGGRSFGWPPG